MRADLSVPGGESSLQSEAGPAGERAQAGGEIRGVAVRAATGVVIGLDPGPKQSALVEIDRQYRLRTLMLVDNEVMRLHLRAWCGLGRVLVIERLQSFGKIAGYDTFATAYESGRFCEAFECGGRVELITRGRVKQHLLGSGASMAGSDARIRAALLDRFGVVGTKKTPGPLFGMKSHLWSALALAVTHLDLEVEHAANAF